MGKSFFEEVASCTDAQRVHGRFVQGVARGSLHGESRHDFPFTRGAKNVLITLFHRQGQDDVWGLVEVMD